MNSNAYFCQMCIQYLTDTEANASWTERDNNLPSNISMVYNFLL